MALGSVVSWLPQEMMGGSPDPPTEEEKALLLKEAKENYALTDADGECIVGIPRPRIILTAVKDREWGYTLGAEDGIAYYDEICRERTFIPWGCSRNFVPFPRRLLPEMALPPCLPLLDGPEGGFSRAEADRRHFWNLLVAVMPLLEPSPPLLRAVDLRQSRRIRILNMGCGLGWDALPAQSFFGGKPYGIAADYVSYVGIDLSVAGAVEEHEGRRGILFIEADATCLDEDPLLSTWRYDVIILRHPEVLGQDGFVSPMWYKMFKEAVTHLVPGGIILMTFYRCTEYVAAEKAMTCLGAQSLFSGVHPLPAHIPLYRGTALGWRDAYISVWTVDPASAQ